MADQGEALRWQHGHLREGLTAARSMLRALARAQTDRPLISDAAATCSVHHTECTARHMHSHAQTILRTEPNGPSDARRSPGLTGCPRATTQPARTCTVTGGPQSLYSVSLLDPYPIGCRAPKQRVRRRARARGHFCCPLHDGSAPHDAALCSRLPQPPRRAANVSDGRGVSLCAVTS